MEILLGVSNHHVHLTKEDFKTLFGTEKLEKVRDLVQPHQFASSSFVDIKTEKNRINHLRVIGPFRDYTQAEISTTDSYFLGIMPPITESGDLNKAETIEIIGPCGSVVRKCCIIADRHIHITKEQKEKLGLKNIDEVAVVFKGKKTTIFCNVKLKVCDEANLELHLDTDDANAALLKTGQSGEVFMMPPSYQTFHQKQDQYL